jgi:hypothetical protein
MLWIILSRCSCIPCLSVQGLEEIRSDLFRNSFKPDDCSFPSHGVGSMDRGSTALTGLLPSEGIIALLRR